MKARLLFRDRADWYLKFGGTIAVRMDCYQVADGKLGFEQAYVFGWIAFDPVNPDKRILLDQHPNKPCHLHIGTREVSLERMPQSLADAIALFRSEVVKYFGELAEDK